MDCMGVAVPNDRGTIAAAKVADPAWKVYQVWRIGRHYKGIRGSEFEEIWSVIIRYTDIIFTPYSAEAHKTLPLRTAREQGRLWMGEQQREVVGKGS